MISKAYDDNGGEGNLAAKSRRHLKRAGFKGSELRLLQLPTTKSNLDVIENGGVNSGKLQIANRGNSRFKLLPKLK